MSDLISRQDAIDALNKEYHGMLSDESMKIYQIKDWLSALPSAEAVQGWNNHEVACMLAELFGDACACNYNDIDEWLPLVCDLKDICPNTVGVACWEQFLTHYGEGRKR